MTKINVVDFIKRLEDKDFITINMGVSSKQILLEWKNYINDCEIGKDGI